ncbi:hypothetical protein [Dyella jiangningensis]|uniref:Uncharacterized protein n=1 Tax=Dyella jiangningensis TaxID=1379159 RepID=A0A328NZT1_9GAMM|nr:hypothetical protein [Dyella jiangningensis]RAO75339.1 hypothetical protein CA260_14740 [Dyella jiangningensis]
MKRYFHSVFFALFCLCTASNAFAYDGVVDQCTWCTTDAIFRQTAKQYYDLGGVTLYNLKTGTIHSYVFGLKRGYTDQVEPPPEAIEVSEIPTDPSIYNAFVNVSSFYQFAGYKLQAAITVPYTDLGSNIPGLNQGTSAYNVTEDANLRNRIGIEIVNSKDRWNQVRSFYNTINEAGLVYFGLKSEIVLEVRIVFADGSSALYRMTANSPNSTKLEFVPGSATTPRNQLIPDSNQPQNQGTWYGPSAGGDDLNRFGQHMNTIGAPTNWSSSGGSPSPKEVRCTWKAGQTGNTLVCAATAY